MKFVSACLLATQIFLFIALTVVVLRGFGQMVMAGAWFDERFASTQISRLIAFLAPYLALPVSIILTSIFFREGRYGKAIWLPLVFIAVLSAVGRSYFEAVPEPIQENFGPRPSPYAGFLFLPPEAVPSGFEEVEHRYSKREYSIKFRKIIDGKKIDLDIAEGDNIGFSRQGKLVKEFKYKEIKGSVYIHHHKTTKVTSFNLIWLNPPKQRLAIYLTQTPKNEHTPEDLIKILKSMRE